MSSLEQSVVEKVRALPERHQKEVLRFIEALPAAGQPSSVGPHPLQGMWMEMGLDLPEQEGE